ncbi:MAG: DUF1080 domain-containing protein [Saprospiraceae bacterium]|nr:DUF1080 domain-containing protein [Saprospiraceae bacterium]
MKLAWSILFAGLVFVLVFCSSENSPDQDPDKKEWISLFNGHNLDGWTPKIRGVPLGENYLNTFRVHQGVLQANYEDYKDFDDRYAHLFYKDSFSYYHLIAEYRTVGDSTIPGAPDWAYRNNGLMLHAQPPETMGFEQDFPISLEMQLLSGNGVDERPTANLCTPGTHVHLADTLYTGHCIQSTSKTYNGDTWVRVEAIVLGDSIIHHIVEGDTVFTYTKPVLGKGVVNEYDPEYLVEGKPVKSGYITIQGESHPTEFRKIELLDLCGCTDKKAKNYKRYFIRSDNRKCVY